MTTKSWTLVSLLLLLGLCLPACSDDDDFTSNGDQTETDDAGYSSYLTLNVSMAESGSTRAVADDVSTTGAENGDGRLEGSANERAINLVNVYVFQENNSGVWQLIENRAITTFTDGVNGTNTYRYGTVVFKALLKNLTYRLFAVVNGAAVKEDGTAWAKYAQMDDFLKESRFISVEKNDDKDPSFEIGNQLNANKTRTEGSVVVDVSGNDKNDKNTKNYVIPEKFNVSDDKGLPTGFDDAGFIMASRAFLDMKGTIPEPGNTETAWVEFTIANTNSETNPERVTVAVERVMARLDLGASTTFDGALKVPNSEGVNNGKQYATVTMSGYYPVNISKQSYLFRHRNQDPLTSTTYTYDNLDDNNYTWGSVASSSSEGGSSSSTSSSYWTKGDYVVDPFTAKKTGASGPYAYPEALPTEYEDMYYNPLHKSASVSGTLLASRKMLPFPASNDEGTLTTIGYCLENTTTDKNQQKEFSTGLILSATFVPDAKYVFYGFNGNNYNFDDFKAYATTGSKPGTDTYSPTLSTGESTATTANFVSDAVKLAIKAFDSAESAYNAIATAYNNATTASAASNAHSAYAEVVRAMKPSVTAAKNAYDKAKTLVSTINLSDGVTQASTDLAKAQVATAVADSAITIVKLVSKASENAKYGSKDSETFDTNTDDNSTTTYGHSGKLATTAKADAEKAHSVAIYAYANASYDAVKGDADGYQGDTLYYYNYNFYTSIAALSNVVVLPTLNNFGTDGKEIYNSKGKSNIQILSDYGVSTYLRDKNTSNSTSGQFVTFYHYVIKHYQASGDGSEESKVMSPMKFAVVRNNVYQMRVAGVLALGSPSPDPTDPDPEDEYTPGPNPDEDQEVFLQMELQVRHWVLRDQGTILLK